MTALNLTQPISTEFNSSGSLPEHIAIIMDGNRRWAKERGLPILEGHRRGVKSLRRTSEAMRDLGIRYLTVFAFSTENNNRTLDEVTGLMRLICISIKRELADIHKNGVRLRFIGERESLSKDVRDMIEHAERLTADNTQFCLTVGLNYGSQQDITLAAQKLACQVQDGKITPADITPALLQQNLSTAHIPYPDMLIRTSGEHRISNFLLWEIYYAEIFFEKTYWPDFDKACLERALGEFQARQRRYGR